MDGAKIRLGLEKLDEEDLLTSDLENVSCSYLVQLSSSAMQTVPTNANNVPIGSAACELDTS